MDDDSGTSLHHTGTKGEEESGFVGAHDVSRVANKNVLDKDK